MDGNQLRARAFGPNDRPGVEATVERDAPGRYRLDGDVAAALAGANADRFALSRFV